jgi:acyl carrier protein
MQVLPAVLDDVRRLVAEQLELEFHEVPAAALFFNDLGGESLDLLELSFRIDKHFGVRVRFHDLTADAIELDDQGRLTAASLALLKTKYPFLKLDGLETQPLQRKTDLLTVEALAGFVQMALDAREVPVL